MYFILLMNKIMISDIHYTDSRLANIYDLENSWADDNDFFLSLANQKWMKILDLGCGTWLLTYAFAENWHIVTWLDPAKAMIDIAKKRDINNKVNWIIDLAQNYELESWFDLIVMTGHTFQTILEDESILKVFNLVKKSLSKDWFFVFESRNPNIDWKERFSNRPETIKKLWDWEVIISTDSVVVNNDKISFKHHYKFLDTTLTSESTLRFMTKDKIKNMLEQVWLKVIEVYGDWKGGSFNSNSLEMIFKVQF